MKQRSEFWLVNYLFIGGFLLVAGLTFWLARGLWGFEWSHTKDLVQNGYIYRGGKEIHTPASIFFKGLTVGLTFVIWSAISLFAILVLWNENIEPYLRRNSA